MPNITYDSLTLVQLETFSDPYVVSGISYWVIADLCTRILNQYKNAEETEILDDKLGDN